MMAESGWKVVSKVSGGRLISACMRGNDEVLYKVGTWIKPKPQCGPLAVFQREEDARYFLASTAGPLALFEILYEPSKETMLWTDWRYRLELANVFMPPGTVLADRVMLTNAVTTLPK